MDTRISSQLKGWHAPNERLSDLQISELGQIFEFSFPKDYLEVLQEYNEWEGDVGELGYLFLFSIDNLYDANYSWYGLLMGDIPDYFLFGKDAADTGFAFHKYQHSYHAFGLMSDFETDRITFCGNTFLEFVQLLGEDKCY